jgi:hypothetical protein
MFDIRKIVVILHTQIKSLKNKKLYIIYTFRKESFKVRYSQNNKNLSR